MKEEPATIVSAFYTMNSKFPSGQYMKWIETFLSNIPCHLVFFTDEELIPLFTQMRQAHLSTTLFVALPREQWTAYTQYGKPFWEQQKTLDREAAIHSADLYAIWYEKMEFVRRAIERNPFGHTRFIWCDAGAFRYPEWIPQLQTFGGPGIASVVPSGKITLLQVEPFVEEDMEDFTLDRIGKFDTVNRIGGGIQAGTIDAWTKWIPLYNAKLEERVGRGMFVGKDQTILASLVLQYPSLVHMVYPTLGLRDHWFTLLHVFSPNPPTDEPFFSILIPLYNGLEFLAETLQSIRAQTFQRFEILIGVNGWPSNSEVYQKALLFQTATCKVMDLPACNGKAEALNALVKEARGPWIALCDADDLWVPEKLKIQYDCIHHFPQFDVFGSMAEYFGEMSGNPAIPIGDLSSENFFNGNPLLHSATVLRKSLAEWNGENRILEDYELWIRLRYQKRVKLLNIPYVLMKHRIHKTSHFNNRNAEAVPGLLERLRKELGPVI